MEQINWKSLLNIPRMVSIRDWLVNTHIPHEYLWAKFIEVFVVTKATLRKYSWLCILEGTKPLKGLIYFILLWRRCAGVATIRYLSSVCHRGGNPLGS